MEYDFIDENQLIRLSLHLKNVKYYHDDVLLTSASRLHICLWPAVANYPSVYNACHCKLLSFSRSSTFLDNSKLLIVSFLQLLELLFLCDVTDKISRKY